MATYTLAIEGLVPLDRALHVESGRRYVLGRANDVAFPLPDGDHRISRYHASVEGTLGGIRIQDLGSSNGTFVNGTQVEAAVLRPGDRVRLGKTVLVVGSVDPDVTKVYGLFRPRREGRSAWTTELDILRGEIGWDDLRCASCGADWPPDARDERTFCPICLPGRPLGDTDPRTFGPFDLLGVIGAGPNAVVYEARHRGTQIRSAVKRFLVTFPTPEEQAAWFTRVQEKTSSLHHANLLRTFEAVQDRATGEVGISMEWLRAGNCRKVAGARSALAPMLLLGADLFDALAHLHALGLVHRNVKPDNLLLTRFQSARWCGALSDFCHAEKDAVAFRLAGPPPARGDQIPADARWFTAPELSDPAQPATPGTDVYSAAATVYYLLTGGLPFPRRPELPWSGAALGATRVSLATRRADAPAELVELIDSALLADPAARGTLHAGEIAVRLRRIAGTLS